MESGTGFNMLVLTGCSLHLVLMHLYRVLAPNLGTSQAPLLMPIIMPLSDSS